MNNQPKRPPLVEKLKARLAANPKVSLVDMSIPLTNGKGIIPKLKEVLEPEVEDRYYLRNEIVERIIKETDFKERLVSIKIDKLADSSESKEEK